MALPRIHGPRTTRFAWEGLDLFAIENERIRIVLWPAHGADLIEFRHNPTDLDALWKNPRVWPPRLHSQPQPHGTRSEFYDVFHGGWFVSLPNGFHPAEYGGAPIGCHGDMHSVPWSVEVQREDADEVRVRAVGRSARTPWELEREYVLRAGADHVVWTDTLSNRSAVRLPAAWLQHPGFGGPLIEGAELITPARKLEVPAVTRPELAQLRSGYEGSWPFAPEQGRDAVRDCSRVPARGDPQEHVVLLGEFPLGWGCVWNEARRLGFGMRWDESLFPHAWSWSAGRGGDAYPLWGTCHIITLQPSTSRLMPFDQLLERGEVLWVGGGESIKTTLAAGFVGSRDEVFPLPGADANSP